MAKSKPRFRLTKTDGETGGRSTVGRFVTAEAAQKARHTKRAQAEFGSSDSFGVHPVQRREKGGR